jgi:mono/diheme cytochrome c family protein
MKSRLLILAPLLVVISLATAAPTKVVTYALPDDVEDLTLPPGEGAAVAASNCAACHSLDYIRTQPRGKDAQFWKDTVHKMVAVYRAPIEAADAEIIAKYLAKALLQKRDAYRVSDLAGMSWRWSGCERLQMASF